MSQQAGANRNGIILSIVAIVISMSALGVSVFEVTSLQDQQKASVWPYLEISRNYSGQGFEIRVANKGIGPALVGDVEISLRGKTINSSNDLDQIIIDTLGPERAFSYDTYRARDVSKQVIAPGETAILFGVPWTADTREFVNVTASTIEAGGCFCSVYDDCWSVKIEDIPVPTETCR
ncbi:MAG: hypothetical protein AAFV37_03890 [Pseudomonadota bacterium]